MKDQQADSLPARLSHRQHQLHEALLSSRRTVATAESCTGGWIAKALTDLAGSSAYVYGGLVTYSNEAKTALLGVPGDLIQNHGAVSEPVVRAMVAGVLDRTGADLAVAVSGVAGPGGGSDEKPVGTVWIASGNRSGDRHAECKLFSGDRDAVRLATVVRALELLLQQVRTQ